MLNRRQLPSQERLLELFDYNPESGALTRRIGVCGRNSVAGAVIKGWSQNRYKVIGVDRSYYQMHRVIWKMVYGVEPGVDIDHINGKKNDNRLCNLRSVPRMVNGENRRGPNKNNKTGFLGVCPRGDLFTASIRVNKKLRHLGYFDTPEKAHAAYLEAKRACHTGCTV